MGKRAEILGWYRLCRFIGLGRIYSAHTALAIRKQLDLEAFLHPQPDSTTVQVPQDYIDTQREQAGMQ